MRKARRVMGKRKPEPGFKGYLSETVTRENTAKFMGSGELLVYATPALLALIEKAAWSSVADQLEKGQGTVGTKLDVKHVAATPVGMKVWCETRLVETDGRRLVFSVKAYDEVGLIAEGSHERYIVSNEKFQQKTNRKLPGEKIEATSAASSVKKACGCEAVKREGRRILFEGIGNCRDLGGITNADGRKIREGLLLRSAHLKNATPSDVNDLRNTYSLSEILDLRDHVEQNELPDVVVPGAVHVDAHIFESVQQGITHEQNLPPYEIWPPMKDVYVKFILEEPVNQNLAKAVRRIIVHDYDSGAVLWHCFGGKDRCGMTAALILSILGVSYDVIRKDYMMTNIENQIKADKAYWMVLERGGSQKEADFVYDAHIAREIFLDGAFDALRNTYGDPVSFLKTAGGVTEDEIAGFRKRVLG